MLLVEKGVAKRNFSKSLAASVLTWDLCMDSLELFLGVSRAGAKPNNEWGNHVERGPGLCRNRGRLPSNGRFPFGVPLKPTLKEHPQRNTPNS